MLEAAPSMNPTAASHFAEHLRTHQSAITEAWVQGVKSDAEIASSQKLTLPELADHLPALFNDLIEHLQTPATERPRHSVRQTAPHHTTQPSNQTSQLTHH